MSNKHSMHIRFSILCALIISILIEACSVKSNLNQNPRQRTSFNKGWLFQKGGIADGYHAKFDDSSWRKLNLPHDWAIEGPFDKNHNARTGGLPVHGTAWYRKHFTIPVSEQGKKVTIEFDGVMNNAEVYLNGEKIGERPWGYIGFEVDLTSNIIFGEDNVIAVKVAPEELSSRWYPGAGIYRNVWLEIKNPVHIAHWGTKVVSTINKERNASISVVTNIDNSRALTENYQLNTSLIDTMGTIVASIDTNIKLTANNQEISQEISLESPQLWDTSNPYLYVLRSTLLQNEVAIDQYDTKIGIRSIDYSSDKGFLLNDKPVKFRGVCLHHDLGPLGTAVNYRATQRQLEIMKSMGVNAIRTSHNPPSPEQLMLCDEMGILVQVEAFDEWKLKKVENGYHKNWDTWYERDLRDMIRRDRNHPAVVMWSIGNEMREQRKKEGGVLARELVEICHDEDPSRPVTAGFSVYPQCIENGLAGAVDVVGLNYKPTQYDIVLDKYPDWIVYGSETSSAVSSRGVYHLPMENYEKHESLQVTSYDIISPFWAYPPDFETFAQETMTRSLGEFIWTGFDYLGEPTPYNGRDLVTKGKWGGDWPSRSSYFGAVDLCGFPKDRFYYYQSVWTDDPMVHLLPHWNWEDSGNDTIPVYVYTNADEAELFLNGKSLGRKRMGVDKTTIPADFNWWKRPETTWDSPYRLNWDVAYEKGELKVIAYSNGEQVAEKSVRTAGDPASVQLSADRASITADGYDLSFITVSLLDEKGNLCPLANNQIMFEVSGPATIAAVGNGDPTSLESFQASERKAFNGLCLLVIKSKSGEEGRIEIKATSLGLSEATTFIQTVSNLN